MTQHLTAWMNGSRSRTLCRRHLPLLLLLLCGCVAHAGAADTTIRDARTLLVDGVYRVGARIDFELNDTLQEALQNGVPLILQLRIEVIHERDWLWRERVADLRQRFGLEYHSLTQLYLVENFSTDAQYSFRTLDVALDYIGNVYDLPLIDANLLRPEQAYKVRMRADLEIESLPTPVRLWAYLGSDWSLESDWHTWSLQP